MLLYLTDNHTTWNFIVEKAPWWGGGWNLGNTNQEHEKVPSQSNRIGYIDYEQLRTLIAEVESVITNLPPVMIMKV